MARAWTYHIDELRELKAELDGESVRVVADRPDEAVIGAKEVVIEALGIRVGLAGGC